MYLCTPHVLHGGSCLGSFVNVSRAKFVPHGVPLFLLGDIGVFLHVFPVLVHQDLGVAARMLNCAEPGTIQAVLCRGTKNCSSITNVMEHFEVLYPTTRADGAAKRILRRVADGVSGCVETGEFEMEDPKSKPQGIALASLSRRGAWRALRSPKARGMRRPGLRSGISDVSAFHVKDVMAVDVDKLIHKYNRTLRAAGPVSYLLETDHGGKEETEHKMWSLVRHTEFQEFQVLKRYKVWCFLCSPRHTRCLFCCPYRRHRLCAWSGRRGCCLWLWLWGLESCSPRL